MKSVRGVVRPFVVLYPRVVRLVAAANGWRLTLALGLALIGGLGSALMAKNGRYAEMFNAQAEHYQHEAVP